MKINMPITNNARVLSDTDTLITTTNLKGVINSTNASFTRLSGFDEAELQ